jgi:hypothetical protein
MLNSVNQRIDPIFKTSAARALFVEYKDMKIKNVLSFETSLIISQSKLCNIPEGLYLQILCTSRTYYKKYF